MSDEQTTPETDDTFGEEFYDRIDKAYGRILDSERAAMRALQMHIVGYVVSAASGSYDQKEVFPTYDEAARCRRKGDVIGAVLSDGTVALEINLGDDQ